MVVAAERENSIVITGGIILSNSPKNFITPLHQQYQRAVTITHNATL